MIARHRALPIAGPSFSALFTYHLELGIELSKLLVFVSDIIDVFHEIAVSHLDDGA